MESELRKESRLIKSGTKRDLVHVLMASLFSGRVAWNNYLLLFLSHLLLAYSSSFSLYHTLSPYYVPDNTLLMDSLTNICFR